jgi:hypothetical protein
MEEIDKQVEEEQEHIAKLQFAQTPVTQQPDEVGSEQQDDPQGDSK